jgi:hypothetical protein
MESAGRLTSVKYGSGTGGEPNVNLNMSDPMVLALKDKLARVRIAEQRVGNGDF